LHAWGPVLTTPFCGIQSGIALLYTVITDRMHPYGVEVMYRDSDKGHMDFTFPMKDDLQRYVMQRLFAEVKVGVGREVYLLLGLHTGEPFLTTPYGSL